MSEEQEVTQQTEAPDQPTQEEVQEAKAMGWSEQEHWRGRPEEWLDARAFLEKGRDLMPILRANNRQLLEKNRTIETQLSQTALQLKAAEAAIAALEEHRAEQEQKSLEDSRAELREQLIEASENGDHRKVAEITDKLTQLNAQPKVEPKERTATSGPATTTTAYTAEVNAWMAAHPNYTSDPHRIALANVEAARIRQETGLVGRALLEKVYESVEGILRKETPGASRVGSGAGEGRAAGGRSDGKGYSDLPAEAKAICDKQAARFVGAGKRYEKLADWHKAYCNQYFKG